jgi:hypothetical protein
MRVGVSRLPKSNDVVCGLHSAFQYGRTWALGDFTWKDPIAAKQAGMSLKDYVIGGMDPSFKLKLYRALRAMEDAGHMPGITTFGLFSKGSSGSPVVPLGIWLRLGRPLYPPRPYGRRASAPVLHDGAAYGAGRCNLRG